MIWEPAFEQSGFKFEDGMDAKKSFTEFACNREYGRIKSPRDDSETAMIFGQIAEVSVIPGLKVSFVHSRGFFPRSSQVVDETEIGHGHKHISASCVA
jgi:hypothetical protein